MKKMVVFADSFGTDHTKPDWAWYRLLAKKLNVNVLDFYAMGGYPTIVCYKNFLKYQEKYDHVIFLATDYGKYPKPFKHHYISGIQNCENFLTNQIENLTDLDRNFFENLRTWFIMNDDDFLETIQNLMLKDVIAKRPDACILPVSIGIKGGINGSMNTELHDKLNIDRDWSFWNFHLCMAHSLGHSGVCFSRPKWIERPDKVAAHMTQEANEMIANDIYEYYVNKKRLVLPKTIPHNYDVTYYYEGPYHD